MPTSTLGTRNCGCCPKRHDDHALSIENKNASPLVSPAASHFSKKPLFKEAFYSNCCRTRTSIFLIKLLSCCKPCRVFRYSLALQTLSGLVATASTSVFCWCVAKTEFHAYPKNVMLFAVCVLVCTMHRC